MIHLFLGLDPSTIRREPYIPLINTLDPLSGRELGLNLHPLGTVVIFPNVGSYLGGDLIAGIGFSRLRDQEALSLLVDVGTNAEVVMGNSQWLVGCAGAAGPALEGGVARMGMAAGNGAIEQVRIDPKTRDLTYELIGQGPPAGICGSGLIDLVAEMFLADLIDIQGKFNLNISSERWTRVDDRPAYLLVTAEETLNGRPLVFSQVDLDILLRSKAAMYTILTTLVQSVGYSLARYRTVLYSRGLRQPYRSGTGHHHRAPAGPAPGAFCSPGQCLAEGGGRIAPGPPPPGGDEDHCPDHHLPGNERQPGFHEPLQRGPLHSPYGPHPVPLGPAKAMRCPGL